MNTLIVGRSGWHQFVNAPLVLLVATGVLLGSMLPMARVATAAGWPPLAFAFWPALGSGLIFTLIGWQRAAKLRVGRPLLYYSLITGVLSVALPNSVTFIAMPKLGTSLTSLVYTLPPLFTYIFAWSIGIERYRPLRLAGILLGLVGAALLVFGRSFSGSGSLWWLMLALCAPVSIAIGNVYRKQRMPHGVDASLLAGGMLLGGALSLLPLLVASNGFLPSHQPAWGVMLGQCIFTSLAYLVYFRFQKVADPVYFSQLGYVMSATGVFSGLLFFSEHLTSIVLVAIAVIVAGIALVNLRSHSPRMP